MTCPHNGPWGLPAYCPRCRDEAMAEVGRLRKAIEEAVTRFESGDNWGAANVLHVALDGKGTP